MNKYGLRLLLSLLIIVLLQSCSNEDNPAPATEPEPAKTFATLKEALESMDRVVKIEANAPKELTGKYKEVYELRFQQPVDHTNPDQKTFEQLVTIRFRGFDRPTILMTDGYDSHVWSRDYGASLGDGIGANIVEVEHRNYGKSMADDPQWACETGWQVSTDLHEVCLVLKPVLTGRWMSMGVSKDGETAVDYCYYYPDDMQLCAAFCSPFHTSLYDLRPGKYMMDESGTEEERQVMKAGIRRYLQGGEQGLYKTFCELVAKQQEPVPTFTEYVFNVFEVYFAAFSYYHGADRKEQMAYATDTEEELFEKWYSLLDSNRDPYTYTYYIDCFKEQGFYTNDYEQFSDLLDGTSFDKTQVNATYLNPSDRWIADTYDNSHFLSILNEFLPQTSIPTLLVYSKEDPWTGARPQVINPVTTKMIINPDGIHCDNIDDPEYYAPQLSQEITDYIRRYVY